MKKFLRSKTANMPMNRRELLKASLAGAAMLKQGRKAFAAPPGNIQAVIDAAKIGKPIDPMIFGGYMEPATTSVWAEMLSDRKFAMPVVSTQPAPAPAPSGFRSRGEPFRPVGPEGTVEMDSLRPFVGNHSPRVKLDGSATRDIQQSRLRVVRGKAYEGRVYLAGDPGARVVVRLVWGSGASDSQSVAIPALTSEYKKFSFKFTPTADSTDARLEIVGAGSGTFHIGTASLMPADNVLGFHPGMIRLFKEEGFKMFKWPGGNFVSSYDWRDGLGDRDKRPPRNRESNDVGLHDFIALNRLVGAEPDLAIDSGYGSAREAAEEVEYCNGSVNTRMGKMRAENGSPEPFNIRCWTIGNEMYGPWQAGHISLNQYWVKHNNIVEAMKKVDPTIKVVLGGASICEKSVGGAEQKSGFYQDKWAPPITAKLPYEFGCLDDWDRWLIAECADNIDFLSEHTYAYPDVIFDAEKQSFVDVKDPLQFRARRIANRVGGFFDAWDKYVEKMPSLKDKDIKFIFDEWGNRNRSMAKNGGGGFGRQTGMLTPLSYALLLHELFRHSDKVAASCATGGLRVLTDNTGDGVGMASEGVVFKLLQNHFLKALPVAVDGNSPQPLMPGTAFVDRGVKPTGSPTYPLDILAAFSSDRKKFLISVVNPTEEGHAFTPKIGGVKLSGQGELYQIAPLSFDSTNEVGKEPAVKIVETAQNGVPEAVQAPPFSVRLYEFEVA
jgi:alpha-N-arabinofuranosidase